MSGSLFSFVFPIADWQFIFPLGVVGIAIALISGPCLPLLAGIQLYLNRILMCQISLLLSF
jgi:hypothetical protein